MPQINPEGFKWTERNALTAILAAGAVKPTLTGFV